MYSFGFYFKCLRQWPEKPNVQQSETLIFLPLFQDRHNTPAVVLACNATLHPGDRQASSKWFRKPVKYK